MKIAVAGGTGTIGRLVVSAVRAHGHEPMVLARSTGVNVVTGEGLDDALRGVDTVIDVTNSMSLSAKKSRAFFSAATTHLLQAESRAGVNHHVALSIVGIDNADASYYAGKLAQERLVSASSVPHTIVRAAQFHEFAGQILAATSGPLAVIPRTLMRPAAARDIADYLVEVAAAPAVGRARDLVGPRDETLIDLARQVLAHRGDSRRAIEVRLPGRYGSALASGALRGDGSAQHTTLTFSDWLDEQPRSADAKN